MGVWKVRYTPPIFGAARFGISTNSVATTSTTGGVPHVTKGRDIAFDLDDGLEIFLTVDINRHH